MSISAAYGRAAIQTAILLNGGASVALLAFLSNLAIAHQAKGLTGNYATFKTAFVCFVIGVMLAASGNVIAFLIQNVAIDHPSEAEGRLGRRLRTIGIGTVVASLILFAIGITMAVSALEDLVRALDFAA
jgi:hypothetical protein